MLATKVNHLGWVPLQLIGVVSVAVNFQGLTLRGLTFKKFKNLDGQSGLDLLTTASPLALRSV